MANVELHQAFMWDCPECGVENFVRAVTADLPPEEKLQLMQELGIEPVGDGDLLMAPDEVKCASCNRTFSTTPDDSYLEGGADTLQ